MEALNPDFTFPSGDTVSCGNRADAPKAQRKHEWRDAGTDIRHRFDGRFTLCAVKICIRCGRDDDKPV